MPWPATPRRSRASSAKRTSTTAEAVTQVSVATAQARSSGRRSRRRPDDVAGLGKTGAGTFLVPALALIGLFLIFPAPRSEEHTSELQSPGQRACRLLPG